MAAVDYAFYSGTYGGGLAEAAFGASEPMAANAARGDIYLDEENHTAMALGGGRIGHSTGSETGGVDGEPGDQTGDQTGRESRIQDYYRGSWDGVLHYNGKADTGSASNPTGSGAPSGDVVELAERVIAGELGNGEERKRRLGSYYSIVRRRVNEMLS